MKEAVCSNHLCTKIQKTRSLDDLRIETVEYISSGASTRSNNADTLFYLVNYENNQGFMLLSADERMMPVYAMSDEGRLDLSDTITNEGLRQFLQMAKADAQMLPPVPPLSPGPIVSDPFDYTYDRTVSPKLSKNIRQFHQDYPFNKYCFTNDGQQALVGCVPLAAATLVAYYHENVQVEDIDLDWESINNDVYNDDFYNFLSIIGSRKYINVRYGTNGTNGTGGSSTDVPPVLRKFGLNVSNVMSFDEIEVAKALENGLVYVDGNKPQGKGHAWVLDGYIRFA